MGLRLNLVVLTVFLHQLVAPQYIPPVQPASAESNCDNGDFVTPSWNKTVERLAKVPNVYNYDFIFEEGRRGSEEGQAQINEEYDGPEETWMTWEPNNDLRLLR